MSIFIKPGVKIGGIQPEGLVALVVAYSVYDSRGYAFRWTSALENAPGRVERSKHPLGLAIDCGIRHIADSDWSNLTETIATALGAEFDVILERDLTKGPHIHIEFSGSVKV